MFTKLGQRYLIYFYWWYIMQVDYFYTKQDKLMEVLLLVAFVIAGAIMVKKEKTEQAK